MDHRQPPARSGIPLPKSRLPLPTSVLSRSLKELPSRERLRADTGLNIGKLRQSSAETFQKPALSRSASPTKDFDTGPRSSETASWAVSAASPTLSEFTDSNSHDVSPTDELVRRDGPRPSLSDRTVETLSRIPPSPSPSRRKSSFYETSSRPPSSLGQHSRPASRPVSRQDSTVLRYGGSSIRTRSPVKRSTSLHQEKPAAVPSLSKPLPKVKSGSKSMTIRNPRSRPSLTGAFQDPTEAELEEAPKPLGRSSIKTRKPSYAFSPGIMAEARRLSQGEDEKAAKEQEARKVSKSSSVLRESIAKAKAAKKAARESGTTKEFNFDTEDPFNQLKPDTGKKVLQKRVETGRTTGHLNISAMGLKEIPDEVMKMYDFEQSGGDWYENVDLTKFMAADNEFESLPDNAFPDIDVEELGDMDELPEGYLFGGLEALDLHGNQLSVLPRGLRRLQRLQSLNLSRNKLTVDSVELIAQFSSLTDLRLAENGFVGPLNACLFSLSRLELVDLHGNAITELPVGISSLSRLKVLDVANNKLSSLPFSALGQLPLVEIRAQNNDLHGTLMGSSQRMDHLQVLNVSNNSLDKLVDDRLELPNIQQLMVSANRLNVLPAISTWQSLLTLSAGDNMITELPAGFCELSSLRIADFTGNSIYQLDDRIGLMDNLVTLNVSNNPIRERKYLTLDTEQLKLDLRNKCEQEADDVRSVHSVQTEFTLAPESPHTNGWRSVTSGVLDKSEDDLYELDADELAHLTASSSTEIQTLRLRRNHFDTLPTAALLVVAHSLAELDLSKNPLRLDSYLTAPLKLPRLATLRLAFTGISTLIPFMVHLEAPALSMFDASNNQLSGALPRLRDQFPRLATLVVSDNTLSAIPYEAVEGLQTVDVSNNNIDFLPPRIGLLGGETIPPDVVPLRRFDVGGNCFRVPQWHVVSKGTQAVLAWLRNRVTEEEMKEWGVKKKGEGSFTL